MDLERTCRLLENIREGDQSALDELLERYGERLRRMIPFDKLATGQAQPKRNCTYRQCP